MNHKYVCMCIYSYFGKGCRIKCAQQLRKVLWVVFEFIVFQGNLKEWQEKWVLKESNKSRFDSYSVRNNVLILSHITLRDCRVHSFSDNLSRNSCMWIYKITKIVRAFSLVKNLWFIVPVNSYFYLKLFIKAIDHTFYGFIGVINPLRMLGENEKSL